MTLEVSSLGYVVTVETYQAEVVTEDGKVEWIPFFNRRNGRDTVSGDFVRIYKRKGGNRIKYASYFFSPKDVATAIIVLGLGWQVQKARLPYSEEADKLFLMPPCLEVKKQLEPAKPE